MKNSISQPFFVLTLTALLASCHPGSTSQSDTAVETATPVTITGISKEMLTENVELNAVSSFLLKTNVKVNANGYLQKANVKLGDYINKGDEIFELKTKEAMSLENTVNSLDSSFHFKGIIRIKAPGSGYITNIDHQAGDYVQDGEQVAVISDAGSFVFLLGLPYELTPFILQNHSLKLKLPDGTILNGEIDKAMPTADAASQTQSYAIKVNVQNLPAGRAGMIPENLIAKVTLVKRTKANVISLPKEAVLTNETQNEFWIMKLMNDSTAVKIPVEKGMETADRVEILSPTLGGADKILLTGNYGLADTAKVQIDNGK